MESTNSSNERRSKSTARGAAPLQLSHQITILADLFRKRGGTCALTLTLTQLWDLADRIQKLENLVDLWVTGRGVPMNDEFPPGPPPWIGQFKTLKKIRLSRTYLDSIPESIRSLTALEELSVSCDELRSLPSWLGELTALERIYVRSDQLRALPDGIRTLNLKELTVLGCKLQSLPSWIGELTALKKLDARSNRLTALPDGMESLKSLKELLMSDNKLVTLPNLIGELTALETLQAADCQLNTLPDCMRRLSNLKALVVADNELLALPSWIGELTGLELLDVRNNRLTALPADLEGLKGLRSFKGLVVSGNRLQLVPRWFGDLTARSPVAKPKPPPATASVAASSSTASRQPRALTRSVVSCLQQSTDPARLMSTSFKSPQPAASTVSGGAPVPPSRASFPSHPPTSAVVMREVLSKPRRPIPTDVDSLRHSFYVGPIRFPPGFSPPVGDPFLQHLRTSICREFAHEVPQMQTVISACVDIAQDRHATQADVGTSLSLDEALALALYTYDLRHLSTTADGSDNFYHALNAALRSRDPKMVTALLPFLWHFKKALDRLPLVTATGFRGVPQTALDALSAYTKGRQVYWNGATSVSVRRTIAEGFADQAGLEGAVLCVDVLSGRTIKHFSAVPLEDEVLLEPGTKLVVTGPPQRDASGRLVISLLEMDSKSKILF